MCRAIGVSNFLIPHLEELKEDCSIVPHVNQVSVTGQCTWYLQPSLVVQHVFALLIQAGSDSLGQVIFTPKDFVCLWTISSAWSFFRLHVFLQVEYHPFQQPEEMLQYCHQQGIVFEGYCPLAKGQALSHPTILKIAEKYERTPSQICIRWSIQVCISLYFFTYTGINASSRS